MDFTHRCAAGSTWIRAILAIAIATLAGCSSSNGLSSGLLAGHRFSDRSEAAGQEDELLLSKEEAAFFDGLDSFGLLRRVAVQALRYNHVLQDAPERVNAARALYAAREPSVISLAATQHTPQSGAGVLVPTSMVSEQDFFDRVSALPEGARAAYLSSPLGQKATRQALLTEVAQRYVLMRAAADREQSAKALAVQRREQLKHVQSLGLPTEPQTLATLEAEAERADQLAEQAAVQFSRARKALELEIGIDLPSRVSRQLSLRRGGDSKQVKWLSGLSSDRLLERIDVQEAEQRLKASHVSIQRARAAFLPDIELSTPTGVASEQLRSLFPERNRAWIFVPDVTAPLIDDDHREAASEPADASIANYGQVLQVAFHDLAQNLGEREALLERIRSQSLLNELAQEQSRDSLTPYAGDLCPHVQAVLTEQALLETRLAIQLNLLSIYRVLHGADASAVSS